MAIRKSSSHIIRLRPWLGYGLYTLALLIGFLYLLFPYQNFQRWIEHRVEQRMGIQIHAKQRKAGPFWFEWNGLHLSGRHPSLIDLLHFPILRVNFLTRSVLYQPLRFTSAFSLWDGRGKGWLALLPDESDYEYRVVYSLTNLDVVYGELPYVKKGTFSWDVDYQWNQNQPFAGQGQGKFSLESVQIEGLTLRPEVVIPLAVSSASGLMSIQEAVFTLRDFRLHGEGFSFSGQGNMQIAPNVRDSRFEGEGILYLSQEFAKQFPNLHYLKVSAGQPNSLKFMGTFRTPSMELNGVPIPLEPSLLFPTMSSWPQMN